MSIHLKTLSHDEEVVAKTPRGVTWARAALTASFLLLAGCGGTTESHLTDYLEELEFDKPLEKVEKVAIGKYRIFFADRSQESSRSNLPATWFKVKFNLLVYVLPKDEKSVNDMLERHRGMLDDIVLTTCRSMALDDLNDNGFATLKFRLTDAVEPVLGEGKVRRMLIDNFTLELI